MRGDLLQQRLLNRIQTSALSLTVHYPAARPAATGASPTTAPLSPLTGPAPTHVVFPAASTPVKPAVTLPCLWLDLTAVSKTSHSGGVSDSIIVERIGWVEGAQAVARVAVASAAVSASDPLGDTVFTDCERVSFQGHDYRVLAVKPISAGFYAPVSYYVWLAGAVKQ